MRKRLTERRRKSLELTRQDRANRCPICLRALPTDRRFVRVIAGALQAYDSQACLDEAIDREEAPK